MQDIKDEALENFVGFVAEWFDFYYDSEEDAKQDFLALREITKE